MSNSEAVSRTILERFWSPFWTKSAKDDARSAPDATFATHPSHLGAQG